MNKKWICLLMLVTCLCGASTQELEAWFEQNREQEHPNHLPSTNQPNVADIMQLLKRKREEALDNHAVDKMRQCSENKLPDINNFISKQKIEAFTDSYDASEMGHAATHLSAAKAMGSTMQDNLGGIRGKNNNPSAFHGLCRRCTVTLGKSFKDCCQLNGIAQGLLGGCREEEKQLAKAAVKDKRCHKVANKYCSKRFLRACVEKKEAYCCYGSQMAKVIQEIAHNQLNLSWGDGENPKCGSLTAKQLSQLDFDTPYAKSQMSQLIDK